VVQTLQNQGNPILIARHFLVKKCVGYLLLLWTTHILIFDIFQTFLFFILIIIIFNARLYVFIHPGWTPTGLSHFLDIFWNKYGTHYTYQFLIEIIDYKNCSCEMNIQEDIVHLDQTT